MDPNAGRFVEEAQAESWMQRIEVGEVVKIKGEEFEDYDPLDEINVIVWFCQGHLLKFAEQPMESGDLLYSVFSFERDDTSMFGFGVPNLMRDSQKAINGGWRMTMDNAGLSVGPQVVVDTTAPRLEVSLRQLEAGKVQLAWRASDQNLDPTKLRLEYIQSGSADWQPVSVVPQASGQTAWTVQRGGMVAVRGSISDLANNMADAQSQVRVESAPQGVPELPASDYRQPIANSNQQRFPASQFSSGVNRPVSPPPQDPFSAFSNQPARTHRNPASAGMGSTAITPMPFNQFVSSQPDARPDGFQPRYPATPEVGRDLQPRSNGRIVNSRTFEIGYQVEQVGPSGVGSVEMYITQDNGRKWYKYGADPDHVSPFRIDVPQEGMYGFALRVLSGVGMSDNPPQAGDQPEIVIAVDTTPPIVNLLPVQQGQGVSLNTMLVRWQASDAHPADKSIAISYAVTAAGPWQPIDGWLSNSGSYLWTVGVKAPPKIYLRLSARDAAGNIAHTVSSQPIIVDMSKPSARFVDVESINFAPRGQKK